MSDISYYDVPQGGGAKTGMILGIIGVVVGVLGICAAIGCALAGYLMALASAVLGIVGLVKAKDDQNPQTAKILGIVAICLGVLVLMISCANSLLGAYFASTGQFDWEQWLRQLQQQR